MGCEHWYCHPLLHSQPSYHQLEISRQPLWQIHIILTIFSMLLRAESAKIHFSTCDLKNETSHHHNSSMSYRQWAGRSLLLLFAAFGLADGAHHLGGYSIKKRLISCNNRPSSLQTPSHAVIRSLRAGAEPVSPTRIAAPGTSGDINKLGKGIAVCGLCISFVPFFIQPAINRFWKEFKSVLPNRGNGRLATAAALVLTTMTLFLLCLFSILVFF